MNHILTDGHLIDYERYSHYLEGVKELMDRSVQEFAVNPEHFNLSSPSSLHDAWLEELRVTECQDGDSGNERISVSISLLGPFHDRRIILEYSGVVGYEFSFTGERFVKEGRTPKHGDVHAHEMRLEDGYQVHEILFADGHRFVIRFRGFIHREESMPV